MSQPSTGLATPQTDAFSNGNKQASIGSFRPVVPLWFLDNVRTFDELQQLQYIRCPRRQQVRVRLSC